MAGRINRELVAALYLSGYSQGDIAKVYGSVSGHISKVLKAQGVQARPRGEKVTSRPYEDMPDRVKRMIEEEGEEVKLRVLELSRERGGASAVKVKKKAGGEKKVVKKKDQGEAKKRLAPAHLDKACISLLKDFVTNTPFRRVKFTKRPQLVVGVVEDAERMWEMSARHLGLMDVFQKDSKGKRYYGYNFDLAVQYKNLLLEKTRRAYPDLCFRLELETTEEGMTIRVGCRNKY